MSRLLCSEPDCSTSLEPFLQRLAETIPQCVAADPADPRNSLRSSNHRPRTLERSYYDAMRTMAARPRSGAPWPTRDLAGGRLLVYFPDADLCDGAAEAESAGFFDVFNAPPWDTWVAFATDDLPGDSAYANYLIAYVPPVFVDACGAGIEVNPEECIRWLEDANTGLGDLIRQHHPELLSARSSR